MNVGGGGWNIEDITHYYYYDGLDSSWETGVTEGYLHVYDKSGPLPDAGDDPTSSTVVPMTATLNGDHWVVRAEGLSVDLAPGQYWIGITPIGPGGFFGPPLCLASSGSVVGDQTASYDANAFPGPPAWYNAAFEPADQTILVRGTALPEVLWDQSTFDTFGAGFFNSESGGPPFGITQHVVNDVTIGGGGWNVDAITVYYYFDGLDSSWETGVTEGYVHVYDKSGPLPDSLDDPTTSTLVPMTATLNAAESLWTVTASGLNIDIAPGEHWIGITPIGPGGFFGPPICHASNAGVIGDQAASYDANAFPGPPAWYNAAFEPADEAMLITGTQILWDQAEFDVFGAGFFNSESGGPPFGITQHAVSDVTVACPEDWRIDSITDYYYFDGLDSSWETAVTEGYLHIFDKTGPLPESINDPTVSPVVPMTATLNAAENYWAVTASDLGIVLSPGEYWVGITPIGPGGFFGPPLALSSSNGVIGDETASYDVNAFPGPPAWFNAAFEPADLATLVLGGVGANGNDSDGDGVVDCADNCPDDANEGQEDADGDGEGDVCDDCTDTDGDTYGDPGFAANTCTQDNCPDTGNAGQGDTDGDGVGDACDTCTDTDGDGYGDPDFSANTCPTDLCPSDPNKVDPGTCGCNVDDSADSDGDGTSDCVDQCAGVDDSIFAPECAGAIPAVSEWGLLVLALLLLVGAKLRFGVRYPRGTAVRE